MVSRSQEIFEETFTKVEEERKQDFDASQAALQETWGLMHGLECLTRVKYSTRIQRWLDSIVLLLNVSRRWEFSNQSNGRSVAFWKNHHPTPWLHTQGAGPKHSNTSPFD